MPSGPAEPYCALSGTSLASDLIGPFSRLEKDMCGAYGDDINVCIWKYNLVLLRPHEEERILQTVEACLALP